MIHLKSLVLIVFYFILFNHLIQTANAIDWDGRWFPHSPQQPDNNPVTKTSHLYDSKHGITMGVVDSQCDDAKINLTVDWDMNPINYTCFSFTEKLKYLPRDDIAPSYLAIHIPRGYSAPHRCMYDQINYDQILPTYGAHRPLWAKYGEYTFLPRQRWLHNLEHGAIVLLYHPCADKNEVNLLRKIVTKCLYRHIITPYNLLPAERPIALVSWGRRLLMSKVDLHIALDFIRSHALKGPEQNEKDGQYDLLLERPANIVSDKYDSELCKAFDPSKITM